MALSEVVAIILVIEVSEVVITRNTASTLICFTWLSIATAHLKKCYIRNRYVVIIKLREHFDVYSKIMDDCIYIVHQIANLSWIKLTLCGHPGTWAKMQSVNSLRALF